MVASWAGLAFPGNAPLLVSTGCASQVLILIGSPSIGNPWLGLPGSGKLLPDRSKEVQGNPLSGSLFLSVHLSVYFHNTGNDPLKTPDCGGLPRQQPVQKPPGRVYNHHFKTEKPPVSRSSRGQALCHSGRRPGIQKQKTTGFPFPVQAGDKLHGNDNSRFCAFCPNVNTPLRHSKDFSHSFLLVFRCAP